jgi:hypothetical protein
VLARITRLCIIGSYLGLTNVNLIFQNVTLLGSAVRATTCPSSLHLYIFFTPFHVATKPNILLACDPEPIFSSFSYSNL